MSNQYDSNGNAIMNVEWSAPPPVDKTARRRSKVMMFVDTLKTRPGQWAVYPSKFSNASSASHYRRAYPDVEWTMRRMEDGRYQMWGRWSPDEAQEDTSNEA